jgi:hypothetical protein
VVLVLRGSGSLRFLPGDLLLKGGKLVFHVPAGGTASGFSAPFMTASAGHASFADPDCSKYSR